MLELAGLMNIFESRAVLGTKIEGIKKYMKTESNWIKISDRKPTEADLPVFIVNATGYGKGQVIELWRDELLTDGIFKHLILWMPAKIPEPPKDDNRDKQDLLLAIIVMNAFDADPSLTGKPALIKLAFTYERSAIRHLIQRYRNGELPGPEVIRMISGRVKL